MPVNLIFILMTTGLGIGFLSGLLGIGGGIIMTPVQYSVYTSSGWSTDIATKVAFATSLAVIFPTAASGVWRHHRQDGIYWRAAILMGLVSFTCSFIGAWIASGHISGSALKIAFGVIGLIIAVRMLTVKISEVDRPIRKNIWLWFALALPVGVITGILGIGGGVIVIPILVLVLRFRMRNAVATSLGIMLFSSAGGMLGWVINGLHAQNLPSYTLGYIYWPAWIALSITSISLAQVGALVAHKIPGRQLNYIFVVLVFIVSLYMLGVFSWIIGKL
ncbi:MAG TPA: sulfite exporter TauE/SafE family protein [Dehalococcoidales bacterium]